MEAKLAQIKSLLKELGSVLVAYSGEIDSTYVASLYYKIIDKRAVAELHILGYTQVTVNPARLSQQSKRVHV